MTLSEVRKEGGIHRLERGKKPDSFFCWYIGKCSEVAQEVCDQVSARQKRKEFTIFFCSYGKVPLCEDVCFSLLHNS